MRDVDAMRAEEIEAEQHVGDFATSREPCAGFGAQVRLEIIAPPRASEGAAAYSPSTPARYRGTFALNLHNSQPIASPTAASNAQTPAKLGPPESWSGLLSSAGVVNASMANHRQVAANTTEAMAPLRAESWALIT